MTPRSRTVDDGRMADPANVTWSCRRRVAHHMKSVFAGFNFRRLDVTNCAMSSVHNSILLDVPQHHELRVVFSGHVQL